MWFKNLQIYRLAAGHNLDLLALDEQLSRKRFQPCSSQELESRGWLSPCPGAGDALVHSVGGQWLIALGVESRLLPSSVVKQVAEERAEEIEAQQGFKPGRKQMKDIREDVTRELMPRAFTRRRKVHAWIDPINNWLGIDAPSQARAEDVLEALRQSLDVLPVTLLRTQRSPSSAMADWLAGGEVPGPFSIDQDCELKAVTEDKAAVRFVRHPLEEQEIRHHLEAGKLPTRLALTFDDRLSFVLTEKLEIKRLDFLDVVKDKLDEGNHEDAQMLFDAGFMLMTAETARMLPCLLEVLGGEQTEPAAATPSHPALIRAVPPAAATSTREEMVNAGASPTAADDPPF